MNELFPCPRGVACSSCGAIVEDDNDGGHIKKWNDRAVCTGCVEIEQKSELLEAFDGALQEIANLAPDNGNTEVAATRLNRAVSIALTAFLCATMHCSMVNKK